MSGQVKLIEDLEEMLAEVDAGSPMTRGWPAILRESVAGLELDEIGEALLAAIADGSAR